MSDPLRRPEPGLAGLDARELGSRVLDLFFVRAPAAEAPAPIAARRCRLPNGTRLACVSLGAGCGTSTIAALLAQRSGGAGADVRLLDLDLAAPSLALLAGERTPTLLDALAADRVRGRRWGSVSAVFGAERDPGADVADALGRFVARMASDAAVVADAGALTWPGSAALLRAFGTVAYVTTPRAAHVHAAARGAALLGELGIPAVLLVNRATPAVADGVAGEVGLTLAGAIPEDPFLARDDFRIRAETARALDLALERLA